jgi:putative transposase
VTALEKRQSDDGKGAGLEQALIARFGSLGRVDRPFLLRSDNGLVFTSRAYTRVVRSYG